MDKAKLIEWGKVATAVAAVVALISAIVMAIVEVGAFKLAVERNTEEVRELRTAFNAHVEREDELITQLRIAVASLESAQRFATAPRPNSSEELPPIQTPPSSMALARARAALIRLEDIQMGHDSLAAEASPASH